MRFATFIRNEDTTNKWRIGAIVGFEGAQGYDKRVCGCAIVELPSKQFGETMLEFAKGGERLLAAARTLAENVASPRIPLDQVTIKAPITGMDKFLCIGMNYVDHCEEQGKPVPTEPLIFSKFASCIASPGDDIEKSRETEKLDYEVELAIVIGKRAKRVSAKEAGDYILGYTVCHDVSARDLQLGRNGGQWLLGKAMDGFAPLGPSIVTADELDINRLGIRCRVNGEVLQDSTTAQLCFDPHQIVEYASRFMTLLPGDVISTGTPPGVGVFRKPVVLLKDGDVVECEVDGIGAISNRIVDEKPAAAAPAKRAVPVAVGAEVIGTAAEVPHLLLLQA